MNYLLDTNIVLYFLGGQLKTPLPNGRLIVSFVTEIELLSYPSLKEEEERIIRGFLEQVSVVGLTQQIKDSTIFLRKKYNMKTPDALIAATGLSQDSCVLTNDLDFRRIKEVRCKSLTIK